MTEINEAISSNVSSGDSIKVDFSKLITDLTKIKDEGNALYKEKKLEEAKQKFVEGLELFKKESPLVNKERGNNEQCKEVLILYRKILSNLALCYYKEKNFEKAIEYDLKNIEDNPKFGKSIVRLFNSYSKLNKIQQAVYYGDLFLELDHETRDKFKGTQTKVQEEKNRLKKIQQQEKEKIKKDFAKYGIPALILLLAILVFLLFRKK
jgi:tetratricopeptide (TPR) repeat protein